MKIDSALRGNTGLEIAAALESFHCDAAIVCPAFPNMHRVVEAGFLRVTDAPEFVIGADNEGSVLQKQEKPDCLQCS